MVTSEVLEMERSETVRTLALEGVLDKLAEVLDGVVEGGAVLLGSGLLIELHLAGPLHEDGVAHQSSSGLRHLRQIPCVTPST